MAKLIVRQIQDGRIWIHSTRLGYGRWFYNEELEEMMEEAEP